MTSLMRFGISGNTYAISGATLKGRRNENQDLFAWSVVSGGRIESCIGGEMLRSSAEGRPDMMLALVCDGFAIWLGFRDFGTAGGAVVIVAVLVLSLVVTVVSLRAKTWQRFSLRQEIRSN